MPRLTFLFTVSALLLSPYACGQASASDTPGIVKEKPAEGRFVEIDGGYMVPYAEKIPGTDASFEMVPIPGGTFTIGSPEDEADRSDDEGPQVKVEVPPFWMSKYEVTWGEYKPFMALTDTFVQFDKYKMRQISPDNAVDVITSPSNLYDPSFTFDQGEDPRQPAITMTQFAAKQYTKWLSKLTGEFYRLPSEAEWEYAARAGTTTAFSFGDDIDDIDDYGWHYDNADDTTQKVGEKKPNPWGLYDMHGNVEEWTLDFYDEEWYSNFEGKTVQAADFINWPKELYPRVLRGGSWDDDPDRLRSAARSQSDDENWKEYDPNVPKSPWWYASDYSQDVGMRIIRPLTAPEPGEGQEKFWKADIKSIQQIADKRIDEEGRGERGLADELLPAAIEELRVKRESGQ